MFTLKDIIAVAVQIESNAEEIYRDALRCNAAPEVSELLSWIAEEEARHGEWFEELGRSVGPDPVDGALEKMGRIMLRSSVEEQSFSLREVDLARVDDAEKLLVMSVEFEQDTVAFYQMLRPFLQDPDALDALDRIIEEEQRHIRKLDAMRAELAAERVAR